MKVDSQRQVQVVSLKRLLKQVHFTLLQTDFKAAGVAGLEVAGA